MPLASFATDTADKIGIADRTIRQSIRRATKIDEKVRDRIRDNPEIAAIPPQRGQAGSEGEDERIAKVKPREGLTRIIQRGAIRPHDDTGGGVVLGGVGDAAIGV